MPHIRKSVIDAKMYRHFAVITIAITATIGVFADGEGRKALANGVSEEISERQEAERLQQAQVAKFGQPKLFQRKPAGRREKALNDSDSFEWAYGEPTDTGSLSGQASAVWTGRMNPKAKVPGSYAPYGISQAQWNAMTEEEREAFLAEHARSQPVVSAAQHRRQVDGLMAASAARAGSASEGDD